MNKKTFMENYFPLLLLFLGVLGALHIYFFMDRTAVIKHWYEVVYKLIVFAIICLGTATFPNKFKYRYVLLLLPLLMFLLYIVPQIIYQTHINLPYVVTTDVQKELAKDEVYTHIFLLLYPLFLLTTMAAYRIGGGEPGKAIKIGLFGVIILFAGFYDIIFFLVTSFPIPETLDYAHHTTLIFGKALTYSESVLFACAHIPLIVLVFKLPFDKWIKNKLLID